MPVGPTREEFDAFSDRLYHQMDDGFRGVHERLDRLNDRTGKGEVADAEVRTRMISLEKEIFRGRGRRLSDRTEPEETDDALKPMRFTKREATIIGAGLSIIFGLMKLVEFLGGKVYDLLTHAKP